MSGKIRKSGLPCSKCGSSDALCIYEKPGEGKDGYCFSCGSWHSKSDIEEAFGGSEPKGTVDTVHVPKPVAFTNSVNMESVEGIPSLAITDRGIRQSVVVKYGVKTTDTKRYYPVYKDGDKVGYKIRTLPKCFKGALGDTGGNIELFGQNLWAKGSGRDPNTDRRGRGCYGCSSDDGC